LQINKFFSKNFVVLVSNIRVQGHLIVKFLVVTNDHNCVHILSGHLNSWTNQHLTHVLSMKFSVVVGGRDYACLNSRVAVAANEVCHLYKSSCSLLLLLSHFGVMQALGF